MSDLGLSRLKNIKFIVFVFNHDKGYSDFSFLVFCVDPVVGQGQTMQVYLWLH